MLLSLEIPLVHINEFLPLTDFPFALAQLYLDKDAVNYQTQMKGGLLDNGMYELGESLEIPELLQAAELAEPLAVIAPDWMDDMTHTVLATAKLVEAKPKDATWDVSGVVQGRNLEGRIECFKELHAMDCRPICFPFRTPRIDTIEELYKRGFLDDRDSFHLLGLQSLEELKWNYPGTWSVDTGKPFKGFRMDQEEIRGHGKLNLHSTLTEQECCTALWNICYMRRLMV